MTRSPDTESSSKASRRGSSPDRDCQGPATGGLARAYPPNGQTAAGAVATGLDTKRRGVRSSPPSHTDRACRYEPYAEASTGDSRLAGIVAHGVRNAVSMTNWHRE